MIRTLRSEDTEPKSCVLGDREMDWHWVTDSDSLIDLLDDSLIDQLNYKIQRSIEWKALRSTDWTTHQHLTVRLIEWFTDRENEKHTDRLTERFTVRLTEWLTYWLNNSHQTTHRDWGGLTIDCLPDWETPYLWYLGWNYITNKRKLELSEIWTDPVH
jgi:hypothetical protein